MVTKEQLYKSVSAFFSEKLEVLLGDNPMTSLLKPVAQRGIDNMITKNANELNKTLKFLEDSRGYIDVEGIMEDVVKRFEEMPESCMHAPVLGDVWIGNGKVSFEMEIPFSNTLKKITLDKNDIMEFIDIVKKNAYV